jgi:predicted aspartyl protease
MLQARKRAARLLILSGLLATTAIAQSMPPTTDSDAPALDVSQGNSITVIEKALGRVDLPTLEGLYKQPPDPVTRVLAAMALERAHYNLDKSTEDARICEHSLLQTHPRVAFYCARFASGNLRLSGREQEADLAELDIAQRFAGLIPPIELDSMRAYVARQAAIAPMHMERPSSGFVIPLQRYFTKRGTVAAKANGHDVELVVDTGASNMLLNPSTAKDLGVRMLERSGTSNGLISKQVPVQFGTLDKLEFSGVTVEHVPVEIAEGPHQLIGIDILKRLGAFRIAQERITVYGKNEPRPICNDPMLISSVMWGNGLRMAAVLPIEGVPRTTLLDTGDAFYLNGNQAALEQVKIGFNNRMRLRDLGPEEHAARFNPATAQVIISGQPIEMTFAIFKDAKMPLDYILGSGALQDMDFYFDFEQSHTCLLLHDHLH